MATNAAAGQGVVPRQLEVLRNTNIINYLKKSGVQIGRERDVARNCQPLRKCANRNVGESDFYLVRRLDPSNSCRAAAGASKNTG